MKSRARAMPLLRSKRAMPRPRRSRRGQTHTVSQRGRAAAPVSKGASSRVSTIRRVRPGEPEATGPLHPTHVPPPLADVLAELREQCRMRNDYHNSEKRLTNQIKAIGRRSNGGHHVDDAHGLGAAESESGDQYSDDFHGSDVAGLVSVHLDEHRRGLRKHRLSVEKEIARIAQALPAWPAWVEGVRGIGPLGFGLLIGETGDLSLYANPAKVWKRMGLAVVNGGRQRRVAGAEALEHGYSPRRRAVMFNLGEALVKQNQDGPYRTLYLERKEIEREKMRPPCPGCKGKAERTGAERCSDAHTANRARRYMEKRFLVDLWKAWRLTTPPASPQAVSSAAMSPEAAA